MAFMTWQREGKADCGFSRDCALQRPTCGWWAWASDRHVLMASLGALPVWLGLGLWAGEHMLRLSGWAAWASFVLWIPSLEELVFRGLLQGQLLRITSARRVGPLSWANLVTTAGFVALHLTSQSPLWALAVTPPSIVLGHLRERLGSLLPVIVLHALYNAGFAATSWWVHR